MGLKGAEEIGKPGQLAASARTAAACSGFGKGGCWQVGKASQRNRGGVGGMEWREEENLIWYLVREKD